MAIKRVGILTGGGDCSGLNAVIRAVTRAAIIGHKATVVGIEGGFEGLITGTTQELTVRSTRDILTLGGTILGTTNKGNPFEYRQMRPDGTISVSDVSDKAVETYRKLGLECLFVVGGEGTLEIGYKFQQEGHERDRHPEDDRQRPGRDRLHLRVPDRGPGGLRRAGPPAHHGHAATSA